MDVLKAFDLTGKVAVVTGGNTGLPQELGPTIVYLASDASSFMTGAEIMVDGGYSIW